MTGENTKLPCQQSFYSKRFDPSEATLEKIQDITSTFDSEGANRMLYAIKSKKIKMQYDELMIWNKYVTERYNDFDNEYMLIVCTFEDFLHTFAPKNCSHFSMLKEVIEKVKDHIKVFMQILNLFTPQDHPSRRQLMLHGTLDEQKNTLNDSILNHKPYERDLFPFNEYGPVIENFIHNVCRFMEKMDVVMLKCHEVLLREKEILADKEMCKYIFQSDKADIDEKISNEIYQISDPGAALARLKHNTSAYRDYSQYGVLEFSQKKYHGLRPEAMLNLCRILLLQIRLQEENVDETDLRLFGNDRERMARARNVLSRFDSLLPEKAQRKDFSQQMFCFCQWAECITFSGAYKFFERNYNGSRLGQLKNPALPKLDTIECYKNQYVKGDEKRVKAYEEFVERVKNS